jgi:predicted NBD/HSP70 family sugar kinase
VETETSSAGSGRNGVWRQHSSTILLGTIASLIAVIVVAAWNKAYAASTLNILLAVVVVLSFVGSGIILGKLARTQERLHQQLISSLRERDASLAPVQLLSNNEPVGNVTAAVYAIARPARLVGLDVGRSRLTIGTLRSDMPMVFGLPGHSGFGDPRRVDGMTLGPGIYDELVGHIRDSVKNWEHLDGIGIGLPGEMDAAAGTVVSSPGGLAAHEPFVEHLAARITREHMLVELLVDDPKASEIQLCREVAKKIYIDNDANCAARGVLNRHRQESTWRNFACVLIGTGVGAGLVLDRRVYFGSCGVAGEIGHTICQLHPAPLATALGAAQWVPQTCACGHEAGTRHWEPIVSGRALAAMMQQLAPALYEELEHRLGVIPAARHIFELVSADAHGAAGTMEREAYRDILREGALRDSTYELLYLHANYVAIGLANLVNILNLDHVVLGGGVLDGLMALEKYRTRLLQATRGHLFETAQRALISIEPTRQTDAAWQGAALLFLDEGYRAHKVRTQ